MLGSPRFWGNVLRERRSWPSATTVGVVIVGIMAAFVIARYDFRGRRALYTLFTAGLMFPLTVAALPLTLLLRTLGLHGTYLGVIIPSIAFALPTTIIILVPFLRAIPARARGGGRPSTAPRASGSSGASSCRCRCPDW